MKLLLFLTNAVVFSVLVSTCHKNNNTETGTADGKVMIDTVTSSIDSLYATGGQGDTLKSRGIATDTLSKDDRYKTDNTEKHEAPKHGSPDQMKIDSIKKSKEKTKKGN